MNLGRKILMHLVVLILFACALLFLATPAKAAVPYDRIKDVAFRYETGIFNCSATAVREHTMLTADHCIVAGIVSINIGDKVVAVKKAISDGDDHVLLVLDYTFSKWAYIRRSPLVPGEEIFMLGNPGDFQSIFRRGYYAGEAIVDLTDPNFPGKYLNNHRVLLSDMNSTSGDSGAGIFDERGLLVSAHSGYVPMRSMILAYHMPLQFTAAQYKEAGL